MKCPYRKMIQTEHRETMDTTAEFFMECYGKICPFYKEGYGVNKEHCAKAREDGGMN